VKSPSQPTNNPGTSLVYDKARALADLEGDTETYETVLNMFLEDVPKLFEEMHAAHAVGDLPVVCRHAHSMKSMARMIGGQAMGDQAQALETAAEEKNAAEVAVGIVKLPMAFATLQQVLGVSAT